VKRFFKKKTSVAGIKPAPNALIFIVACLLLAWLVVGLWPSDQPSSAAEQALATGWQQSGAANPFGKAGTVSAQPSQLEPSMVPTPVALASTSLAGTQPDGSWTVNAQGQLLPSRALRQRFDYYLSLIGELPLADLRALLRQNAQQNLSEPALGQAMALWDKYVQLQQYAWKHAVDLRQPSSWSAALVERQIVRREKLGADVAHAFYAVEDSALQSMLARVNSGAHVEQAANVNTNVNANAIANTNLDTTQTPALAEHPQAQEREAQLRAQWQAWDARVDAARRQLQTYNQAPELSAPQRAQAKEQYLSQHFQGAELIRVRSLLGLH
jgi:lipase chaperone LimK